jgi:cytochrome c553
MEKIMRMVLVLGAVLILAMPAARGLGADLDKKRAYGKHLAAECTACHSLDGIEVGIPSIVAWPAADFVHALKAFKDGHRSNPAMVSVAQSLDQEQMEALALYFGSLPKPNAASAQSTPAPEDQSLSTSR